MLAAWRVRQRALPVRRPDCPAWPRRSGNRRFPAGRCCGHTWRTAARQHGSPAAKPNEIWQADHTLLDLWVITPSGSPGRPWLTLIEDDYSRAVAGYAVNLGAHRR